MAKSKPIEFPTGRNAIEEYNRQRDTRAAITSLLASVGQEKINAPHITELCAGMMELHGGLMGFCKAWKNDIDTARRDKPGSQTVLQSDMALMRLVQNSTEHRQSAPDLANMSDADFEREVNGLLGRIKPKLHDPNNTIGNRSQSA